MIQTKTMEHSHGEKHISIETIKQIQDRLAIGNTDKTIDELAKEYTCSINNNPRNEKYVG